MSPTGTLHALRLHDFTVQDGCSSPSRRAAVTPVKTSCLLLSPSPRGLVFPSSPPDSRRLATTEVLPERGLGGDATTGGRLEERQRAGTTLVTHITRAGGRPQQHAADQRAVQTRSQRLTREGAAHWEQGSRLG